MEYGHTVCDGSPELPSGHGREHGMAGGRVCADGTHQQHGSLPPRRSVRGRYLFSNWLWALIVLALIGVVIWGWAFDFSPN